MRRPRTKLTLKDFYKINPGNCEVMAHKEFKDVQLDRVFLFCQCGLPLAHGLASGPWQKIGIRKYTDGKQIHEVGTVKVKVIPFLVDSLPDE